MTPTLLFDLECSQPNSSGKRHGGGRYAEVVFERIVKRRLPVAAYYDSRKWFNPAIKQIIDDHNITLHDLADKKLDAIVKSEQYTHMFSALPNKTFVSTPGIKKFGTQHGLRQLETPNDKMQTRYKMSLKQRIKYYVRTIFPSIMFKRFYNAIEQLFAEDFNVVTVSNHTANAIRAYFPQMRTRDIKVFYSPSTSSQVKEDVIPAKGNYYLIVSANRWDKNALRGIMAFDRLFSNGYLADATVKVTGVKSADTYKYKIKNPDRFEFLGYVDDDVLESLYKGAQALLYPSLNEGFGYPPVEAMKHATPVLASPFTSIPEVCGDAAIYFNPFAIEEIMARIIQISDPDVHETYSARASARFKEVTDRQNRDLDGLIDFIYA